MLPSAARSRPDSAFDFSNPMPNADTTTSTSRSDFQAAGTSSPDVNGARRLKQKRNKPTLSCRECVDRKTKCDRGRPHCIACVKRSTDCTYSQMADLIANANEKPLKSRKSMKSPEAPGSAKCSIANITHPSSTTPSDLSSPSGEGRSQSSKPAITISSLSVFDSQRIDIFGTGRKHPFANYWTCQGGLAEVVTVLPSKQQADILMTRYFEIVDPLYPIINKREFYVEYDHFWSLCMEEKCKFEPDVLALHLVLYAFATQYLTLNHDPSVKTAEFYLSASHQALSISSYLNHPTLPTVQTMILIFYFLVNDNHASDAWTFSGITLRQAYVLQLNRNPEDVVPGASPEEKHTRLRLWAFIVHQDTALAMFLKLPPSAGLADIGPHFLHYNEEDAMSGLYGANPLSPNMGPEYAEAARLDIAYVRLLWAMSLFQMEYICTPRALGLPLCRSAAHQQEIIAKFHAVYQTSSSPFGSYDVQRFYVKNSRLAKQQQAAACSIFHNLMLIAADNNDIEGVPCDLYPALGAAHDALSAFFAMIRTFGAEVNGWWAYQHRAYEQAVTIGNLLAGNARIPPGTPNINYGPLIQGKENVRQMLEVVKTSTGYFEYEAGSSKRFIETLTRIYGAITIV